MEKLIIRFGNKKDFQKIKELSMSLCDYDRDNFDSSLNTQWLNSEEGNEFLGSFFLDSNHCVILAEYDGEIAGYLFGKIELGVPWRNVKKIAELVEIYVNGNFRGKGIGNSLFTCFKDWCIKKGGNKISVLVSFGNNRSINFYKKLGFKDYDINLEYNL